MNAQELADGLQLALDRIRSGASFQTLDGKRIDPGTVTAQPQLATIFAYTKADR